MSVRYPHMEIFWAILSLTAIAMLCVAGILAGASADPAEMRRLRRGAVIGIAVIGASWCVRGFVPDSRAGSWLFLPFGVASFLCTVLAWIYLFAGSALSFVGARILQPPG